MNVLMCDWKECSRAYEWKHGGQPKDWMRLSHVEEWGKSKGDLIVGEQSILLCPFHSSYLQNSIGMVFRETEHAVPAR